MIDQALINWLAGGERGISSNTIVARITGLYTLQGRRGSHPLDPDDLTRCVLLLESCPSIAAEFHLMREESSTWARLVDAWPELVALLDEEIPGWREGRHGSAPKTYALMRKLRAD